MQASTPRNIIVTDWTGLSNVLYHQAVANAAGVGKRLGEFLCWLHQEQMIQLSTTHIVGLSLGAGVLGAAGAEVQERCGQLVSRITGKPKSNWTFKKKTHSGYYYWYTFLC